jgi:hypothetical protein
MRRTIEKMGGRLTLVVEFPDREPVTLAGIARRSPNPCPRHPVSGARTRSESSYFPSQI